MLVNFDLLWLDSPVLGAYLLRGVPDRQRAQGVVSQGVAASQGDQVGAVFLVALFGPVLLTFGLWRHQTSGRVPRDRTWTPPVR